MRYREHISFIPLLFFIIWESGAVHDLFRLITPLYIVSSISAISLMIFLLLSRDNAIKMLAVPTTILIFVFQNSAPYIFLFLAIVYMFYKKNFFLKTLFILSPLAIVEGLGLGLSLKFMIILTFLFFVISLTPKFDEAQKRQIKPITKIVLYLSLILILLSLSIIDPLAQAKNKNVVYDGYHEIIVPTIFEKDNFTNPSLRYLQSIGYNIKILHKPLAPDSLSDTSIFILETPQKAYTSAELGYLSEFVKNGGGLFILGDHTDKDGNLNPILNNFGLHLNFDYSELWKPHFTSWSGFDSYEETAGATLGINRSDALIFYWLKYSTFADNGDGNADTNAYIGNLFPEKDEKYGVLPICASTIYGKGRIVAIANTDIMNGPTLPYNYGFLGKILNYLNYQNSFIRDLWFRLFLILLILMGILRARLSVVRPYVLSLSIILLFLLMQAAIPVASEEPDNQIALDIGHGNIEGYGSSNEYKNVLFSAFAEHYGFHPVLTKDIPEDIKNYKAYVTIGPTIPFDNEDVNKLQNFVAKGGYLIVFDGYHLETPSNTSNYAANSLLSVFDIRLNDTLLGDLVYFGDTPWNYNLSMNTNATIKAETLSINPLMKDADGEISLYSAVEVLGGSPIALYKSRSVISTKEIGLGKVIVVGDHTLFQHFLEYEPVLRYPNPAFKRFLENVFTSLGGGEQNGI